MVVVLVLVVVVGGGGGGGGRGDFRRSKSGAPKTLSALA